MPKVYTQAEHGAKPHESRSTRETLDVEQATLTVEDSHGSWSVTLSAGAFRFRAVGSNTGWHRTRHRLIERTISRAYDEWDRWLHGERASA